MFSSSVVYIHDLVRFSRLNVSFFLFLFDDPGLQTQWLHKPMVIAWQLQPHIPAWQHVQPAAVRRP